VVYKPKHLFYFIYRKVCLLTNYMIDIIMELFFFETFTIVHKGTDNPSWHIHNIQSKTLLCYIVLNVQSKSRCMQDISWVGAVGRSSEKSRLLRMIVNS